MAEPDEQLIDPDARLVPDERDPEAPDADMVDQVTPVNPAERPAETYRGLEVDEWDALEQSRVVELDDDYR
ncbi:MAG: hypothetical protein V7603_2853 [Micromonosporaceae bacterium]